MNKKGFTLIELIVSVILVSVVMVSLSSALVDIRRNSEEAQENTNVIITTSTISRVINNDIVKNDGIRFVECDPNGEECGLVLGNNAKRTLTIKDVTDTTKIKINYVPDENIYLKCKTATCEFGRTNYLGTIVVGREDKLISEDETNKGQKKYVNNVTADELNRCNNQNKISNNCLHVYFYKKNDGTVDCMCIKEKFSTSLLYQDITSEETTNLYYSTTQSGKPIYVRTLSFIKNTDPEKNTITTTGYGFSKINYKQSEYKNAKDLAKTKNVLSKISLGIYNGIDKNDETYNVYVYSTSTIGSTSAQVGNDYTIELYTNGNYAFVSESEEDKNTKSNMLNTITLPKVEIPNIPENSHLINDPDDREEEGGIVYYRYSITKINEKFNVGFETTNHRYTDQIYTKVKKIIPPRATAVSPEGKNYYFWGYYTSNTTMGGSCNGTRVIDNEGNIIVASNYFTSNTPTPIYACWRTEAPTS